MYYVEVEFMDGSKLVYGGVQDMTFDVKFSRLKIKFFDSSADIYIPVTSNLKWYGKYKANDLEQYEKEKSKTKG